MGVLWRIHVRDVCTNRTGHAEVVQIDMMRKSFTRSFGIFANHNPTTLNAQGPDVGTGTDPWFFHTEQEQMRQSKQMLRNQKWKAPIVTQIVPPHLYKAELSSAVFVSGA